LKPAKYKAAMDKPEKPDGKKFIDEFCRFAGLFPTGSAKNTQFFHSVEQKAVLWVNMWKTPCKADFECDLTESEFLDKDDAHE
jgi:hypothetical protein